MLLHGVQRFCTERKIHYFEQNCTGLTNHSAGDNVRTTPVITNNILFPFCYFRDGKESTTDSERNKMTAFNYRQLIRQVPPTTWQYYFQTRKIELPADLDWSSTSEKITDALVEVAEALDPTPARIVYGELRRVWALGNRRGVDALRNMAQLDSPIHDDFPKLTSDAERALWVMANWPDLFETAESIFFS
jgi:hypothetical protein